jgi:transcription elongation factor SPT5
MSDWITTEVEVRIRESHDDSALIHQTGIIRNISGGMCTLFLPEEDKVISVASEHLEPVLPDKGDRVKVIIGDEREFTGNLLSIDGLEGVVKLDRGNLSMCPLNYLCKMPKE